MNTEACQWLLPAVEENGIARLALGNERSDRLHGDGPQGAMARFASFPVNADESLPLPVCRSEIKRGNGELSRFVRANARVVEEKEQRIVARAFCSLAVGFCKDGLHLWLVETSN